MFFTCICEKIYINDMRTKENGLPWPSFILLLLDATQVLFAKYFYVQSKTKYPLQQFL